MLRAWSSGAYRQAPVRTLVLGIAAILYFVSPIDAISDFIPLLGLVDDVTVLAMVLSAIQHDLEAFRRWEELESRTIEAEPPLAGIR
jgi:uncharacterized membrane protein YkvA (DUF1232 family)